MHVRIPINKCTYVHKFVICRCMSVEDCVLDLTNVFLNSFMCDVPVCLDFSLTDFQVIYTC